MAGTPPYIYPGALHIHTEYSHDCETPVSNIVAAAHDTGLHWIIITDHDTLGGLHEQGWQHDVLVIVGHEITPEHNHFLALDVDTLVDKRQHPQDFVDEVYARGGFGIIAHPDDRVVSAVKKKCYTWDDWSIHGPRTRNGHTVGIELWNLLSDWGSQLTPSNKYRNFFFMRHCLRGPTADSLTWWDTLNMNGKRTFGVAGVDAHAMKRRAPWGGTVEVFSYQRSFRSLTNYLVLDTPLDSDANRARVQVLTALKQGRSFFANRLDGEAQDFVFTVSRGNEQWGIGDSPSLAGGRLKLFADMGCNATLCLIHNGSLHTKAHRGLCVCLDQPGVYRLEGYHRSGRPWLFTNPVYVR